MQYKRGRFCMGPIPFGDLPKLLVLALAMAFALPAQADPVPAESLTPAAPQTVPSVTPVQAQQTLDVLRDTAKRQQLVNVLQTIAAVGAKTVPAPAATPSPAAAAAAASAVPAKPSLAPDSLGAEVLVHISHWLKDLSGDIANTTQTVTDFPLLWHWLSITMRNPETRTQFVEGFARIFIVIGLSAMIELGASRLVARPVALLRAMPAARLTHIEEQEAAETKTEAEAEAETAAEVPAEPADIDRAVKTRRSWRLLRRIPLALAVFVLDLVPLGLFMLTAYLTLGVIIQDESDLTRLAALELAYAYVVCRVVLAVTRLMISPASKGLRLIPATDQTAAYVEIWVWRIIGVAAFGNALADIAMLFGLYRSAHDALVRLVMLFVHLFVVIVILQCRHGVATFIRADLEARGGFAMLRNRFGDIWHYVAIFVVMALWVVWAFSLQDGYSRLVHFTAVTIAVLVVARLLSVAVLGAFDRGFQVSTELSERYPGLEARANRYYPLLRGLVGILLCVLTILALLQVWGIDALIWFVHGGIGGRLASACLTIVIAILVAVVVWEVSNAVAERHLARLTQRQEVARSARLRTLMPMLRTALLICVVTVLGLTILSEIGVNIAPLLASAGIVGIAIGFGSQKLVQDLITGLFLLLEDAMQVGDQVTVAGLSGSVEHLSIRTIRLRAGDGSVHIIPFSSVTTVTNTNRGLGNAAVSVNISYGEDTDRVGEVMKDIAKTMREDDAFKDLMLSDLQLWGVDKVDASLVTMVGQIVCKDTGRWGVQREFNRRLKMRFQEEGIEIANPTQTIVLKTVHQATELADGPSAKIADNAGNVVESPPPTALGHDH